MPTVRANLVNNQQFNTLRVLTTCTFNNTYVYMQLALYHNFLNVFGEELLEWVNKVILQYSILKR